MGKTHSHVAPSYTTPKSPGINPPPHLSTSTKRITKRNTQREQKRKPNMHRKLQASLAIAALAIGPLAHARENAPYPHEKLAAFVIDKLDLTSLPSSYRPKKEKGKKTITDYGYTT